MEAGMSGYIYVPDAVLALNPPDDLVCGFIPVFKTEEHAREFLGNDDIPLTKMPVRRIIK